MNNVTVSFQPVNIHSLVFVRNYFCNFFMIYLKKPPGNILHTAKGNSLTNYNYCDYFFKSSKSKFYTTYVIRLQLSRRSSTSNGTKYQSFTPRTHSSYRCDKDRGRWSGNNMCVEPRIKLIFTKKHWGSSFAIFPFLVRSRVRFSTSVLPQLQLWRMPTEKLLFLQSVGDLLSQVL